jgi:hypothetical protein
MIAIRRDPHWTAATCALGCLVGDASGLLRRGIIDDSLRLWVGLLSGHVLHRNGEAPTSATKSASPSSWPWSKGNVPLTDILPAIDRLVGIFGGIVPVALFQILFSPLGALGGPNSRPGLETTE